MDLTEAQLDLAFAAWTLHARGAGMVVANDAYGDAHRLAELGWLERRFQPDGELSWWWTREAEAALDVTALLQTTEGRLN